jgi:hypothetical protein
MIRAIVCKAFSDVSAPLWIKAAGWPDWANFRLHTYWVVVCLNQLYENDRSRANLLATFFSFFPDMYILLLTVGLQFGRFFHTNSSGRPEGSICVRSFSKPSNLWCCQLNGGESETKAGPVTFSFFKSAPEYYCCLRGQFYKARYCHKKIKLQINNW